MSLRDEHLQQALQHAPDRELAPDDTTRKAVLDYAAKALHQRTTTWLQRCWLVLTLDHWHIARWQLAGMGSAITVLLVVVVFWDERTIELSTGELPTGEFKGEPIQVASAPTDNLQRKADAQAESKLAERAPERASDHAKEEKSQVIGKPVPAVSAPSRVIVATNQSTDISTVQDKAAKSTKTTGLDVEKNETLQAASPAISPADKLVVASAPGAVVDQDVGSSRDASVGAVAPAPAEKAAAVTNIAERSDRLGKAEVDKVVVAKKVAPTSESRSEAKTNAKAKTKVDVSSTAGTIENSNIARNIAIDRGIALANKDIQAGILRILTHGQPTVTSAPLIDAVTGYRIQMIEGSDVTISLPDEVEAYNQAMRDWHARSGN